MENYSPGLVCVSTCGWCLKTLSATTRHGASGKLIEQHHLTQSNLAALKAIITHTLSSDGIVVVRNQAEGVRSPGKLPERGPLGPAGVIKPSGVLDTTNNAENDINNPLS